MVRNSHLARQTVSHGQEVGLLSRGEADAEEPQSLLPSHDKPLPPSGLFSQLVFFFCSFRQNGSDVWAQPGGVRQWESRGSGGRQVEGRMEINSV